jgi:hypothetical protein
MKAQRDFKTGIKSDKEFFAELKELAGRPAPLNRAKSDIPEA